MTWEIFRKVFGEGAGEGNSIATIFWDHVSQKIAKPVHVRASDLVAIFPSPVPNLKTFLKTSNKEPRPFTLKSPV